MKTFSHCPKCHEPMLNEEIRKVGDITTWRLTCQKTLTHDILAVTMMEDDKQLEHLRIAIKMAADRKDRKFIDWDFYKKQITITHGWNGPSFYQPNLIPFFEPDLSEYDKFIKKFRTYVTFI